MHIGEIPSTADRTVVEGFHFKYFRELDMVFIAIGGFQGRSAFDTVAADDDRCLPVSTSLQIRGLGSFSLSRIVDGAAVEIVGSVPLLSSTFV